MLGLIRKHAKSWIIKIMLGAIIIVFAFWGVGSFQTQMEKNIASVNGEPITIEEYREVYNSLIEQLRIRFGVALTDDMIEMLQVRRQALDQLIDQKLLLQEATRLNLRVSDSSVVDAIRNIEAFQVDGVFDSRLYKNVLSHYRLTPEEFEAIQRRSMLIEMLRSFILGGIKVSDREATEWFKWYNALVNIDFVLFEPGRYKEIEPSPEEIEAFFDSHRESYKTDPMVKVRFLHFDPDAYRAKVKITDEKIRDYYEANLEEFRAEKTVEARHILIKVDQDADLETVEKRENRAIDILKMAEEGKDFAELAREYSECPSRYDGGRLGAFRREAMVKPFADKAFSMKAGEISEPVRTQFGWHVIKLEKVNERRILSLSEVEAEIRKRLTDEMAKNLAFDEAEEVFFISFEGDDLITAAKERNLNIVTTDFFTREGPAKEIMNRAEFASAAFGLSLMDISNVLDLGDGYYILQVVEKIPERIPELKDVKEDVKAELIKRKQDEKANMEAGRLLSALKDGKSMETASRNFDLIPITTGFFKRGDSVPYIGFEQNIAEAAFKLSDGKRVPEDIIKGEKGYYVIMFRERKEPDLDGFDREKADIKEWLLQQKRFETFNAWLSQIRDRSEISVEEGFL